MITVRYPTGLAVTYNKGWYTVTDAGGNISIYDKKPDDGGSLQAKVQASAGATIEWQRACRSEFEAMTVEKAARYLSEQPEGLHNLPVYVARDLKRALVRFNAKKGAWR